MTSSIIVKVGKQSHLKMFGCKAYRAIEIDEAERIIDKDTACKAVIIENITSAEEDKARKLIEDIQSRSIAVVVYTPDNDNVTAGIADEFEIEICMTEGDLHRFIYENTGIKLDPFMETNGVEGISTVEETSQTEETSQSEETSQTEETSQSEQWKDKINTKENEIRALDEELKAKENEIESLNEQLNTSKCEIDELEEQIKGLTDKVGQLESSNEAKDNCSKAYEEQIEVLKEKVEQLKAGNEQSSLTEEKLAQQTEKISEQEEEIKQKSDELVQKDEELILERKYRLAANNVMSTLAREFKSQSVKLADTVNENNTLYDELNNAFNENSEKAELIKKCNEEIQGYNELKQANEKKMQALADSEQSKTEELEGKKQELSEVKAQLEGKINESKKLEESLSAIEKEVGELREKNEGLAKQAELANSYADSTSEKLKGEIDMLRAKLSIKEGELLEAKLKVESIEESAKSDSEVGRLRAQLDEAESQIRGYKEIIKTAGSTNSLFGKNTVNPINYTGTAQILTVCGSGSYGVTMTAVSIAEKLAMSSSKVLFMDFDLVTSSSDAYLKKMPLLKNIPGVEANEKASSFGIFLEKGVETVLKNCDNVFIPCMRVGEGGVDYFSGLYYRPEQDKLASADFSTLLNTISTQYTYIVVDLGRLGNSEINDSLIRVLSKIAYRNIFVTLPDRFDARNFKIKLNRYGINTKNAAWLMNMCSSNNVDSKTTQAISPIPYAIMKFDIDLQGKHERFYKTRQSKDVLDLFIKSAVLNGK